MPKPKNDPDLKRATGKRLVATREALGKNQIEAAEAFGVEPGTLSMWETGERLIGTSDAIRFCDEFGVTLEWIFRGDASALKHSLALLLQERAS